MQAESSSSAATRSRARRNLVREAMLRAAQAMMAEGRRPSVQEVADRAGVARATAYRQFSSAERLLTEAALDGVASEVPEALPKFRARAPEDAAEALVRHVFRMVADNEMAFRTMLRLSLDAPSPRRGARRLGWAREALAPFGDRIDAMAMERLVPALALTLGVETAVALRDVCALEREAAEAAAAWAARALVAAAVRESAERAAASRQRP
jgi:AcrR family transcriptional regulator